jgi:hypothetical protein
VAALRTLVLIGLALNGAFARVSAADASPYSDSTGRAYEYRGRLRLSARCFLINPDKELPNMKIFTSVLFGATALAGAALTTMPAQAEGVGIQIGPLGIGIGVDEYRNNCRDYGYRHRYYDNCNRYRFDDAYYSDGGEDYRWQQGHRDNAYRYNNAYGNDDGYDRSGWSNEQWRQWCRYHTNEHGLCDRWNR